MSRTIIAVGAMLWVWCQVIFGCVSAAAALPSAVDGQPLPSLAPMLERVTPAVVNIAARGTVAVQQHPMFSDPFFQRFFNIPFAQRERRVQSVGSGVIVDAKRGHVITNHHVIENTEEITVTLRDGRSLQAELVGTDPATDLAVLKVPPNGLTALVMADSNELKVGDFVVAIGNPFGLGQTVTSGIVSALGRSGFGVGNYEDFIQTDASINVGNSGGALVNLRGELVGVNSAIFSRGGGSIGIGFAIPTRMVQGVMQQLVRYGEVRRGLLGISSQDLTAQLAQAFGIPGRDGAVVVKVQPGSQAANAGLRAGDVIVEYNGRRVRRAADLHNAIGLQTVGERVELKVIRDGQEMDVSARIGERRQPVMDAVAISDRLEGAVLADIDPGSPLAGRIEGVLVSEVERATLAWRYGLRPGDVIVSANRQRVVDLDSLQQVVGAGGRALTLKIVRGDSSVFILIQ